MRTWDHRACRAYNYMYSMAAIRIDIDDEGLWYRLLDHNTRKMAMHVVLEDLECANRQSEA